MTKVYDNSWTLFKNDRKEKETHADYRGSVTIDGVDYWLNGWVKKGKNGSYIGGSVKVKDAEIRRDGGRDAPRGRTETQRNDRDDFDAPF